MTDILETPTPHTFQCLICEHTSSVEASFQAHMQRHYEAGE